ncbi:hypothetical protein LCGC14_1076250 [marine sediment metagenome]|uniref:Uncharacterized protein n=1 Tax=marine sediment metagenome TaxID=412755 RepID=A0A0F9PZS9_9ZZZZ
MRAKIIGIERDTILDDDKLTVTLVIPFYSHNVAKVLRVDQDIELEIVEETD